MSIVNIYILATAVLLLFFGVQWSSAGTLDATIKVACFVLAFIGGLIVVGVLP